MTILSDLIQTTFSGNTGNTGFTGSLGYTGSASTVIGYTGSLGYTGSIGSLGYTGSASTVIGYTGSQGSGGATGFTGSQGIQGVTGFVGSQGIQGVTGFVGSRGFDGSRGFTGSVGFTGSSAAIAGATTQIQYNNAGVFGASANFTYDSASNRFGLTGTDPEFLLGGITSEPAAPSAGQLYVYAKSIGGRMMLKQKGPSGLDTPLQASIAQNKISQFNPVGNAATISLNGFTTFNNISAGSSPQTRNVASTNLLTRSKRVGYQSGAATNNYAGLYHPNAQWTVSDGAGAGGFYFIARWGHPATGTGSAWFIGLGSSISAQTDGTGADPATLVNSLGIGASTGDTNFRIFYGGSSAQTPIATSASFPKSSSTAFYEFIMYAPPNANNSVTYRITNLNTSVELSGTLTGTAGTAIPASTTFLTPRMWTHSGSSATAVQIDIVNIYIETDY